MTRNQNAASTSSSCCREEGWEESQRKHLSDIAQRQRLMAFLMAENQVCFYVPRDRNVWHRQRQLRWQLWQSVWEFGCGYQRSQLLQMAGALAKWERCPIQSSCPLPPPRCCLPQQAEPLRRVVALGYEKSLVIIDACENSLESHTCPSVPHLPNSSRCPFSYSSSCPCHRRRIGAP